MKKLIIFLLLLSGSVSSFSQQTNSSLALTKLDYLQKSKRQKTAAWILLGGGLGLTVAGGAIAVNQFAEDFTTALFTGESSMRSSGIIMFTGGGAAMLSSIPLFISARKNKKRSIGLSFKSEPATQLLKNSFVNRSVSSLTLKISL